MKARDLMTKNPECVTREDTLQRAASIMRDSDIGAIPVVDNGSKKLVGIVTDRDITIRHVAEGHSGEHTVGEVMSSGRIATAHEDDDITRVMELMQEHQVRRIPVVGKDEQVIGMIAQADLALDARDEKEVERTVEKISEPSKR